MNIAAMTYDSVEVLSTFHKSEQLGYPLLRDKAAQHVSGFGVEDENMGQGIPRPGIFWLAPDGRINAKFATPGYRTRPSLANVLASIRTAAGD